MYKQGYTQAEIGEAVGLERSSVSRITNRYRQPRGRWGPMGDPYGAYRVVPGRGMGLPGWGPVAGAFAHACGGNSANFLYQTRVEPKAAE